MRTVRAGKRFDRDLASIEKQLYVVRLTPLEAAALLGVSLRMSAAKPIAAHLAQGLQKRLREDWVQQGDLHEVFCVLDVLSLYDLASVQGSWTAHAMQRLIACEQQPGGPYYSNEQRVDLAANAAIARFLGHFEVVLPLLQEYLDTYAVDITTYPLIDAATLSPNARTMLERMRELEASVGQEDIVADSSAAGLLQTAILEQTKARMQSLPSPLQETGLQVWDEMRRADCNHEIVLMPQMFADILNDQSTATDDQLRLLGAANFFCWVATILYDDFIDEEGKPARLPIANVAYRASLDLYRQVLGSAHSDLYNYVERMYDAVDCANAWEVASTRATITPRSIHLLTLPDYGNRMVLADRAFGHTIGPMLLVQQLPGVRPKQITQVQTALKHFLIARQLNDDIHDWRKDLSVGQLSTAVVDLLQGASVGPGVYRLKTLTSRLEEYFFREGLVRLCEQLVNHVAQCRQGLTASGLTCPDGGFIRLLDDLEASAVAAMGVQRSQQAFLETYRKIAS